MLDSNIIYFDNGATSLKPKCVVDAMNDYFNKYTSNIHRGDFDAAIKTNQLYDNVRNIVADFVNCDSNCCVFTSGTTMSINMVVFGYMKNHLKAGDEVLLNKAEHASNVLPWMKLKDEIGIVIKYVPLDENYKLTLDNIKKCVTDKTKVISLAHVTNVLGDVRDVESIGKYCHDNNILFNVDGAQGVPHMKVDFKNSNMDFLSFSGHKLCGPTGVGVLIGKKELLDEMEPLFYGGGMNAYFNDDNTYEFREVPIRLEAGTPPIAEVIGMGEAIKYLMNIGMDNIHKHECELKKYLLDKVGNLDNITIYNKNTDSGLFTFNINGVFAQDTSVYLNHYKIYVRAGNHCAKLLKNEIGTDNTVRVSMYYYNSFEDVDKLVEVLENSKNIYEVIL